MLKTWVNDHFLRRLTEERWDLLNDLVTKWEMTAMEFAETIDRWFANFEVADKELAFKLLTKVDYYGRKRFRNTLRTRRNELVRYCARQNTSWSEVLILVPSQAADSAAYHARDISKEWEIPPAKIQTFDQLAPNEAVGRTLVLFNDTHGSGNQFAETVWPAIADCGAAAVVIVGICIAKKARETLGGLDRSVVLIPDESPEDASTLFLKDEYDRLSQLGKTICKKHPLGYGDTALVVAYYYQAPNNSLPIIWADGDNSDGIPWHPLVPYQPKPKASNPSKPTPAATGTLHVERAPEPEPGNRKAARNDTAFDAEIALRVRIDAAPNVGSPSSSTELGRIRDHLLNAFLPESRKLIEGIVEGVDPASICAFLSVSPHINGTLRNPLRRYHLGHLFFAQLFEEIHALHRSSRLLVLPSLAYSRRSDRAYNAQIAVLATLWSACFQFNVLPTVADYYVNTQETKHPALQALDALLKEWENRFDVGLARAHKEELLRWRTGKDPDSATLSRMRQLLQLPEPFAGEDRSVMSLAYVFAMRPSWYERDWFLRSIAALATGLHESDNLPSRVVGGKIVIIESDKNAVSWEPLNVCAQIVNLGGIPPRAYFHTLRDPFGLPMRSDDTQGAIFLHERPEDVLARFPLESLVTCLQPFDPAVTNATAPSLLKQLLDEGAMRLQQNAI